MIIQGFQKNTLIDYPDKIASIVFTAGCNFRCKFCHNRALVLRQYPEISQKEIFDYLEKSRKWIDAVVITGGEPTIYSGLKEFIQELKSKNFLVKLDTNGSNPEFLSELLPMLDYVAMDIKTSLKKYPEITGFSDAKKIIQSINLIMNSKIPYEFRATILPDIFTENDAEEVGKLAKGAKLFCLQKFQPISTLDPEYEKKQPCTTEQMQNIKKILENYIQKVIIR